ncbi:nucleophile aminohydrolase [Fomitopsis serialis]|uniref:nucleophile aminohydrolase n=1 Tax=Fomitopsis serialis TaxID=139415 RepID=UPI00200833AA|nr:nucleophile aminohydrolase [Neoantrodia serialis]KAH9935310.1 nucleophile aminohydrolase [Neoantrodia serialis]
MTCTPPFYVVAVHGGAGVHSPDSEAQVKRAMKIACRKSLLLLQDRRSSVDAVQEADDSESTTGFGSNLTLTGTVECDASIMCGATGAFGGVGAVSGIRHPVKLARSILEYSRRSDPLGRIAPLFVPTTLRAVQTTEHRVPNRMLVADGALQFARPQGIATVPPDNLVAPRAREEWERWKAVLDSASSAGSTGGYPATLGPPERQDGASSPAGTGDTSLHHVQDTVGAVACDGVGSFAAGVSSGGLLLKHPGRIGEAAMYGAGCWSATPSHGDVGGAACSVSGAGEHIIRAALARSIVEALELPDIDTHETIQRMLLDGLRGESIYVSFSSVHYG